MQDTKEVEEDDAAPAKRGRGRPKGTTKKKSPAKPKAKATGNFFPIHSMLFHIFTLGQLHLPLQIQF